MFRVLQFLSSEIVRVEGYVLSYSLAAPERKCLNILDEFLRQDDPPIGDGTFFKFGGQSGYVIGCHFRKLVNLPGIGLTDRKNPLYW